MPRSRSRSSSSNTSRASSRHSKSKKSKKSSKRSRDSSRDRSHRRDRSSSRDRSRKKSSKKSSRRRSRSRDRSRDRPRRRRYSSRSRSRSRSRSKSRKQSKSPTQSSPPLSNVGPQIRLDEDTERDIVRRTKQIEEIERSGFEQKAFQSTTSDHGAIKNDFEFGTAAEKPSYDTASKVIEQLESEGLCHPDWFRSPEEREAKYIRYLSTITKKIRASANQ